MRFQYYNINGKWKWLASTEKHSEVANAWMFDCSEYLIWSRGINMQISWVCSKLQCRRWREYFEVRLLFVSHYCSEICRTIILVYRSNLSPWALPVTFSGTTFVFSYNDASWECFEVTEKSDELFSAIDRSEGSLEVTDRSNEVLRSDA